MAAYLTLAEFRLITLLPSNVIDEIEARTPGWTANQLLRQSARIDARLAKRYQAPFTTAPYPLILGDWLSAIVSHFSYLKRGVSSLDDQAKEYRDQHDVALKEMEEAANSETGLFELPLRADLDANAVTRGNPISYTEAGPYVWTDVQVDAARDEDSNRSGTFR